MPEPRESPDPRFTRVADDKYQCRKCLRIYGSRQAVFSHYGLAHATVARSRPVVRSTAFERWPGA